MEIAMAGARYELRVAGCLSERARWAFPGMRVATLRSQTSICAEIDDGTDLHELLELCSGMGLRLISVRRLPSISARHDEDIHGHTEVGGLPELPPV
jgi:hypothetical protein